MTIRNILVPLDGGDGGASVLETAVLVAKSQGAHLDVVHVSPDSREAVPLLGEGMSGAMIEEMIDLAEREAGERTAAARAQFDSMLSTSGLSAVDGPPGPGTVRSCVPATGSAGPIASDLAAFRRRASSGARVCIGGSLSSARASKNDRTWGSIGMASSFPALSHFSWRAESQPLGRSTWVNL